MGQGSSKDVSRTDGGKEQRQLREKEERQRRKEEKKRTKREKREWKLREEERKRQEKRERQGQGSPQGQPHRSSANHFTQRSRSSQTTVQRFHPRPTDGDDFSLDPVDNSPDYEDDLNLDHVSLSPPTPTEMRPGQLSLEDIKNLIARIKANDPTLKVVSVSGQASIRKLSKDSRGDLQGSLAEALRRNTYLTELHLNRNSLDDGFAVSLADALQSNRQLTHLSLEGNEISGVGVQALASMLGVNPVLKHVRLKGQDAKLADGEDALLTLLKTNKTLLTLEFDMVHSQLEDWVRSRLAENARRAQEEGLRSSTSADQFMLTPLHLTVMALASNNFEEDRLELAANEEFASMNEHAKEAVAGGLGMNEYIRHADLSGTRLTDLFACTLAKGLRSNRTLTSLNLEDNLLSGEGVAAVANAVAEAKTLKELRIGRQGGGDSFGEGCAQAVLQCLEANPLLTSLSFRAADPAWQEKVQEALRRNVERGP